jgi:hypothetical protein
MDRKGLCPLSLSTNQATNDIVAVVPGLSHQFLNQVDVVILAPLPDLRPEVLSTGERRIGRAVILLHS